MLSSVLPDMGHGIILLEAQVRMWALVYEYIL